MAQAQAELRRLLTKREDHSLPILKRTPRFGDYVKQYLGYYKTVTTLEGANDYIRLKFIPWHTRY